MYPNLKLQLWTSGIRQNRLAHMLGMDEAALSKIINGYREPGAELRRFIAKILEGDEEWLFQRVDRDAERNADRNVPRRDAKAVGGE